MVLLLAGGGTLADDTAAPEWTAAERKKGYVVFQHPTLSILWDTHIPARDALTTKVACDLAQGECESIYIGVHHIAVDGDTRFDAQIHEGSRLIDTWLEPTIDLDVKVFVRHMKLPDRLVYGNVIGLLEAGQTGGFWLTFCADRDTPAGVYAGKIVVKDWEHPPTELKL